jgi:hypothetical protein
MSESDSCNLESKKLSAPSFDGEQVRTQAVVLRAKGMPLYIIAAKLGVDQRQVQRWLKSGADYVDNLPQTPEAQEYAWEIGYLQQSQRSIIGALLHGNKAQQRALRMPARTSCPILRALC